MSNSPQNQDSLEEKLKVAFDSNNSDKNYNSRKALVSSIPAVGSLAVGFFDSYIVPPATQRLHIFLETLVQELKELKSKIESVNFESPVFQTICLQARQIAFRTHKEQKFEALRNVVLNSSIPSSVEDDVLAMFLNWIDGFTALHISTLKYLHYLDRYAPEDFDTYFPMLEQNKAIYNQVLKDLADRGLINLREDYITEQDNDHNNDIDPNLGMLMSQMHIDMHTLKKREKERKMNTFKRREDIESFFDENWFSNQDKESKTTELGKQFIKFIEYPSLQTEPM